MALDVGRVAYEAYVKEMDLFSIEMFLPWEELTKVQQDGWRSAAVAVLQYIDKEQKNMDLELEG